MPIALLDIRVLCLAAPAALATTACGSPTNCAVPAIPALRVAVVDSISGGVPTDRPTLTVTDGAFQEVDVAPAAPADTPYVFLAADDRPGTYALVIRTSGYHDWTKDHVVVRSESCASPRTVALTARLLPE